MSDLSEFVLVEVVFPLPRFVYVAEIGGRRVVLKEPGANVGDRLWLPKKIVKILLKLPYVKVVQQ